MHQRHVVGAVKKSRVDAIIKAKVAEAEVSAHRSGVQAGRKQERDNMELLIQPSENDTLIGQRPEYPIVNVALMGSNRSRVLSVEEAYLPYVRAMRVARFRCIREAFAIQDGPVVSWYRWQFDGIQ